MERLPEEVIQKSSEVGNTKDFLKRQPISPP